MPPVTIGRICLTAGGIMTTVGAFIADWSKSHLFNPAWSSHAKWHLAQGLTGSLGLAAMTLYFTWRTPPFGAAADSLQTAAMLGSFYSVTAISAVLYPGTRAVDPEFGDGFPQLPIFLSLAVLPWAGYIIDTRKMLK